MQLTGYFTEPLICAVMLCVLRYDLRAPLLALCLMLHLMLCIAPFILLRPKKRLVCRASHIASRPVPRFLPFLFLRCYYATLLRHTCLYISFLLCVGNSVLGLTFKCRPIYYHPMFPNIRLKYSNQETTS